MKMKRSLLLLPLLWCSLASAQVKIGDNPQNIGPASLLELESTDRVLVITRVTTTQMEAITPSGGALVYNTEEDCLFYHNGQRWINLCEALGLSFTAEAIVNDFPTIAITRLGDTVNFEVGQIRGSNIVDFSISGQDIQDRVISQSKLANASVGTDELQDNAVTAAKIAADVAGTGLIQNATGALEVDVSVISGNGDIVSEDLVVGGAANALFGEVTLEITPGAVGTPELADDAVTSEKIAEGQVATQDLADDAVTPEKLDASVAGAGLVQNVSGALEVDVSGIEGDGTLSSPLGTIALAGNPLNALFENVEMDVAVQNIISSDLNNDLVLGSDGAIYINVGSVQTSETITNLTQDINTGIITYTNENGVNQAANIASSDAGNLLTIGSDGGGFINQSAVIANETTTSLVQDATTGIITYTNEDGVTQPANITSSDPGNLLSTGSDGGSFIDQTAVTVNETTTSLVQDATTGIITYTNEVGVLQPANITSSDPGNLLTTGSDGGSFIELTAFTTNETTTTLLQNATTGVITYTNEDGVTQPANITSNDPGNLLSTGTDGGSFIDQSAVTANETTTSLIQDATSGVITYTNEEGTDQTANITSDDPGNLLITGSDGGSFIDQTVLDGTFATDTELSGIIPSGTQGSIFYSDGAGNLVENNAQLFWDETTNQLGVGTNNPQNKLHVTGQTRSTGFASSSGTANEPAYSFYTANDSNTGMFRAASDQLGFSTAGIEAFRIDAAQNIGIGIITPEALLHVAGDAIFDGNITVTTINGIPPDYVFEKYFNEISSLDPAYRLWNLDEVYEFIQKHKHLPGIPSAREIVQNGLTINLALLKNLEKIEELFLHTIEQEKKIERLQDENTQLSKELKDLKSRLVRLEQLLGNNKDQ